MWSLIFFFMNVMNILSFIYPFLVEFDVRMNVLKLKGIVSIKLFNKIKFEFRIRVKHGYIYINHKNKLRKEKISNKNVNLVFIMKLINQLYFREQFLKFFVKSNFGYSEDACVTAVASGNIDIFTKMFLGKIKNNKKSAHILVSVEPKYNEDVFNIRVNNIVRISVVDLIYTLIYTKLSAWRKV
ncbi:MAG: DUF2953 domain-containing protein [Clostridiales bacterium]|nr:DUF2953 domain-containing protein [Clostridiales bacterium]